MVNVIRLVNGGALQVRTGVLHGVGPEGPEGPEGPAGPTGPTGTPALSLATGTGQLIPISTTTNVAFGTEVVDELSVITSSTVITIADDGDYTFSVYVRAVPDPAARTTTAWAKCYLQGTTSGVIGGSSTLVDPGEEQIQFSFPAVYRHSGADQTFNLKFIFDSDIHIDDWTVNARVAVTGFVA